MGPTRLVRDAPLVTVGAHVRNATLSAAVTLTAPEGAGALLFTVEAKSIRARLDGSAPDASTGLLYPAGGPYTLGVVPAQTIKVIEAEATAIINYQWVA